MYPKLIDGKICVPKRVEEADGTIGDGYIELSKEDPSYDGVKRWIEQNHPETGRFVAKPKRS
jgi:hypothetical protein